MGVEIALGLLFGLLDRAAQIQSLIQTAKAEGRDITEAELDTLRAADDAARVKLDEAIKQAQTAPAKP